MNIKDLTKCKIGTLFKVIKGTIIFLSDDKPYEINVGDYCLLIKAEKKSVTLYHMAQKMTGKWYMFDSTPIFEQIS